MTGMDAVILKKQFQTFKTSTINEESIWMKEIEIPSPEDMESIAEIFKISISPSDLVENCPQSESENIKIKIMYDAIKDYDWSYVKLLVFFEEGDFPPSPTREAYLDNESTCKQAAASLASNLEEEFKCNKFNFVQFLRSNTRNLKDIFTLPQ
ncbi:hypothetical protein TrispH2_010284 [Trichoplax sp. H2]|nr:hypothetical protein TrispH2_010284 [Trichoplax sp. H2]|eukprot:RDD37334.1 hypothetical protein TrispH2_010284 [Trichoplax sp. H2]